MSRPYEVIRSEQTKIGRFKVVMDTLQIDGQEHPYSYIMERDFVCVLPLFENNVIYLRQYRHAVDCWKLELPCGVIEKGEKAEHAAARELLEETGCRARKIMPLGQMHAKAGTSTATVYLFAAICEAMEDQKLDPAERIKVLRIPKCRFSEMVDSGEFDQVYGLVSWYRYQNGWVKDVKKKYAD